jgi:hypothetical protein
MLRLVFRTILPAAAIALAGCQSIGPPSIHRDRLDYAGAIADSWKQQTLLNIIRLRYFDTPTFLDVASVISSYQLQGEVRAGAEFFPGASLDNSRTLGIAGSYSDRPTISYSPLSGEKFVNSLLRPIPPQAVFAMIVAGHRADFIFQSAVRAINDVYNYSGSPARARREDAEFGEVISALRRVQQAGALGMRVERRILRRDPDARDRRDEAGRGRGGDADYDEAWIFFRERVDAATARDIALLKQALGLSGEAREFRLVFGSLRQRDSEVALLTRSIMEIMVELSDGVQVPPDHVAEGRVRPSADVELKGPRQNAPAVAIRSGSEAPADAYVAARYRGRAFWIEDRDLPSKRMFTFLRMFSSIAETGIAPQIPVLTIPAN